MWQRALRVRILDFTSYSKVNDSEWVVNHADRTVL
jgi:hypothetical protein